MKDLNLMYRVGQADTKWDGKNFPTALSSAGNLAATFVSAWLDHGSILKQTPMDGMSALFNIPVSSVVTTGAPTNFIVTAKVELSPDNGATVLSKVESLVGATFVVTANAASQATYTRDGVASTIQVLPLVAALNVPYALARYSRLTITIAFTAGTAPALNATGLGAVDAWIDFTLGNQPGLVYLN